MAYLLPIFQMLKNHEQNDPDFVEVGCRPRAIIIAPSRELALQITVRANCYKK